MRKIAAPSSRRATTPERFCPRRCDSKLLTACAKSRRLLFVCGGVSTHDFARPTPLRLPASNVSLGQSRRNEPEWGPSGRPRMRTTRVYRCVSSGSEPVIGARDGHGHCGLPHDGELDVTWWWCAGPGAMKIARRGLRLWRRASPKSQPPCGPQGGWPMRYSRCGFPFLIPRSVDRTMPAR